jgi:N-acetylglucosaminyl-diphospho-decaprenol L-rhamnosyltransferase
MTTPDLSVVIVTYRSREDIASCLQSVKAAVAGIHAEIVVIDNASGDGTVEIAQAESGVRVVALPQNVGFSAGINAGLRATTGRYVWWVNPDGRLIDGSVRDVLAWMDDHPDVGIIGGKILDPDGTVQRSARSFPSYGAALGHRYSLLTRWFPGNPWSRRYLRGEATFTHPEPVDWVSGACVLHRRAVSEALHGLDEQFFMYVEDVDFCLRAWKAGWKVYFHPGIVMEHAVGGSSKQVNRPMILARHRSMWRYYRKHFRTFWPKDVVVWCAIWGRASALWVSAWWRAR